MEASKARKAQAINDDEALFAESTLKKSARSRSSVKTTTTLKLGKEKAEITTTAKKVLPRRSKSIRKIPGSTRKPVTRTSSARKSIAKLLANPAKTAPPGSRKQSAVKAAVNGSARSLHGKRVGAKSPFKP